MNMRRRNPGRPRPRALLLAALTLMIALSSTCLSAPAAAADFSFGVIGQSFIHNDGETALRSALAESDADDLAFVVVNGIKSASESCSDRLYTQRRSILEEAQNGII